jgi:hypothetical protein
MRPQRFNSETDLPPMPFDERICRLAQDIKDLGLVWMPHVGCFVWDPDHHIKPVGQHRGHCRKAGMAADLAPSPTAVPAAGDSR